MDKTISKKKTLDNWKIQWEWLKIGIKTEFSLGLTKFRILDLNVFIEFIFLRCSLRFPHASAQCRKKDDLKVLVLARKVFILF